MEAGRRDITQTKGDTFKLSVNLTVDEVPADFSGATIEMLIRSRYRKGPIVKTWGVGSGLSVTDNRIETDEVKLGLTCGLYWYSLKVDWPDGREKTYLYGTITINHKGSE